MIDNVWNVQKIINNIVLYLSFVITHLITLASSFALQKSHLLQESSNQIYQNRH